MTASVCVAGPIGSRLGGFSPGQTFTLTVEDRQCFQTKGKKTVQTFIVPTGIPKFDIGQTVKLTIGKKGQLKGPGFSLAFEEGNRDYNEYLSARTVKNPTPDSALLTKDSPREVQQVSFYFYDKKTKKESYSVTYLLR